MAKKPQKTFFERLNEKNDKHDEVQRSKVVSTSQKKRKTTVIAVLASLAIGVTAAIAIPLGLTVGKINYVNATPNSSIAYTFTNPLTKAQSSATLGSVIGQIENTSQQIQNEISDLEKQMVFYLYNQEVTASQEWQRIYNASLLPGESPNNSIALSTINQIRQQQQNKISDLKQNFIQQYGFDNWQREFLKTLSTDPQYGGATSEAQAVDNLTFNQIKTFAEARFNPSFQSVTSQDVNRVANETIYKTDSNGNIIKDANGKPIVLYNKGDKINTYYITSGADQNVFFNASNPSSGTAFLTSSFVTNDKSATNLIQQYFQNNSLYVVTNVTLPGVISNPLARPFTLTDKGKTAFETLAQYWIEPNPNGSGFIVENGSQILANMKPVQDYFVAQNGQTQSQLETLRSNYQVFLNQLTLTAGNTYGTSGIQSLNQIFKANPSVGLGVIAQNLYGSNNWNSVPEISLAKLFNLSLTNDPGANAEYQKLVQDVKTSLTNVTQSSSSQFNIALDKLNKLNTFISNYLGNLTQTAFNDLITAQYNNQFIQRVNGNQVSSFVYRIQEMPNAVLVVDSKGIYLLQVQHISSLDQFKEFLQNDIKSVAQGNPEIFQIQNSISSYFSQNEILLQMLNDPDFVAHVETLVNPYAQTNGAKYDQATINNIKNNLAQIINGTKNNENIATYTAVSNEINTLLTTQNSYNFQVNNGSAQFVLNYNTSQVPTYATGNAQDYVINTIKSLLQANLNQNKQNN